MKHTISMRWLANPNQGHSQFPHNLWSAYENPTHYESGDSCAHWMVILIPPIMLIISFRMTIIIWICGPISLNTCLFVSILGASPKHKPRKYRCLIEINNQIRHIYFMGSKGHCYTNLNRSGSDKRECSLLLYKEISIESHCGLKLAHTNFLSTLTYNILHATISKIYDHPPQ